jgi:hypothetical protein
VTLTEVPDLTIGGQIDLDSEPPCEAHRATTDPHPAHYIMRCKGCPLSALVCNDWRLELIEARRVLCPRCKTYELTHKLLTFTPLAGGS